MKKWTTLSLVLLLLTACVSKKKYAELQTELETIKTQQEVNAVNRTAEVKTAEEYDRALGEMEQEMSDLYKRMELAMASYEAASGQPYDPVEAQRMIDEQKRKKNAFEAEETSPLMEELGRSETQMRFTKQAFEKAIRNYTASDVKMVQNGGRLVISIRSSLLFSGKESGELSPSGETVVNRLAPAFNAKNNFRILVVGIAESGSQTAQATMRALTLSQALGNKAEARGKTLIPASIPCDESYAEFSTCDRIDIVLEQDYEAAIGTLRYEPKY